MPMQVWPALDMAAPQRGVGGGGHVGVVVDDHGVLATALHEHRDQALCARRHDLAAGGGRAGEGDLVDARARQRGARLAQPGDDLQHLRPLRHRRRPGLRQPHADAGRVLARLEDDGVAGRQGVGQRPHRREDRVVPRADDPDDAQRLVLEVGALVGGHQAGRHPPATEHLRGVLGRPLDVVDRQGDLEDGVGVRLAVLAVHQVGQLGDAAGASRPSRPAGGHAGPASPGPATTGPPRGRGRRPPAPARDRARGGWRAPGRWPGRGRRRCPDLRRCRRRASCADATARAGGSPAGTTLQGHLDAGRLFADVSAAVELHPRACAVTGTSCGVRIEQIDDPLMRQIRYLDELVDELARGRPMEECCAPSAGPGRAGPARGGCAAGRSTSVAGTHPRWLPRSLRQVR